MKLVFQKPLRLFFILFLLFLAVIRHPAEPIQSAAPSSEYVKGELLVKFKTALTPVEIASLGQKYQIKKVEKIFPDAGSPEEELTKFKKKFQKAIAAGKVKIDADKFRKADLSRNYRLVFADNQVDIKAVAREFSQNPQVEYAEPNYITKIAVVPNDPDFSKLWGLDNSGQTGGTSDADIDAPEAWEINTGQNDLVVAVIDTGIDYNHPDLAANIYTNPNEIPDNGLDDDSNGFIDDFRGWDFYYNDNNPMDDNDHGTHVAGTIGAVANNGIGLTGIAWNVKLLPIKILNAIGRGAIYDAVKATRYATQMGVRILNNSWGGTEYSQTLYDAIAQAASVDALVIAAAGNNAANTDINPFYPASYNLDNIIAVASTDHNDNLSSSSDYGSNSVDLAAPGVSIYSTIRNNQYTHLSGTSMATPHVAAAVALAHAQYPDVSLLTIKNQLLSLVDLKSSLTDKVLSGGRLNLHHLLFGLVTPEFTPTPIPTSTPLPTPTPALIPNLKNRSFEIDADNNSLPDNWKAVNLTADDKLVTDFKLDGAKSFRFLPLISTAAPQKNLYQTLNVSGNADEAVTVSVSSYLAKAVTAGKAGLMVVVYNTDGSVEKTAVNFPKALAKPTTAWRETAVTIVTTKPYNRVMAKLYAAVLTPLSNYYVDKTNLKILKNASSLGLTTSPSDLTAAEWADFID